MKITDAQMKILQSATPEGWVEPIGRYRTCDALAKRGLLSWWTLGHNGWQQESGPTYGRPRNDIFRITDFGHSLVSVADEYNRARGNLADGDDPLCETMQTRLWVHKTDFRARNELARASLSATQRSAIEQIGQSASEALPAFYVSKEARLACYGKIRPDNRAGGPEVWPRVLPPIDTRTDAGYQKAIVQAEHVGRRAHIEGLDVHDVQIMDDGAYRWGDGAFHKISDSKSVRRDHVMRMLGLRDGDKAFIVLSRRY